MCIKNGHVPTEEERKTIREGYKVFRVTVIRGKVYLRGVYYDDYYFKVGRILRKWNKANLRGINETLGWEGNDHNAGFHVFLEMNDANLLLQDNSNNRDTEDSFVVLKVQMENLLEIGLPNAMGAVQYEMNGNVVTCEYVRIIPRMEEIKQLLKMQEKVKP